MTGAPETIGEYDLHAYADGQLDGTRAERVERWLTSHPEDQRRVDAWRKQNRLIQALHDGVPERSFAWPGATAGTARRPWMRHWRAAAAGLVLFAAGGASGWFVNERVAARTEETAELTTAAISAHKLYTAEGRHSVEVRAGESHLLGWLSRRIGHELIAPDLKGQGYAFVGGRLLPGANGPAAQLMYENRSGRRLTLYAVRSGGSSDESAYRFAESQGTRAFYWIDGPVAYALIGELDRATLLTITRLIHDQVDK